jgi:hypothetical protein
MPLPDHFRPPLYPTRHWESFHARWAGAIADALHRTLPPRYFAEIQVHLGSRVEADVAEFERSSPPSPADGGNGTGGGVAVGAWAPPVTTLSMPAVFPDQIEARVIDREDDARLVAVVELVSPAIKDRAVARQAFAAKSAEYLQRGVGLVMVDVVTGRLANLHDELVRLMGLAEPFLFPADTAIYAAAYRPVQRGDASLIDLWPTRLTVGQSLPVLPLWLRGGPAVPLDLEATYMDTRQRSRID